MALNRKSKVSAEFSMASLTDIIFLLLIFFMLSSSLVAPNALNLKLPGRSKSPMTKTDQLPDVRVNAAGTYAFNGRNVSPEQIDKELRTISRRSNTSFTISPEKKAPVEKVVFVMDLAMRYNLNAVLLPEE